MKEMTSDGKLSRVVPSLLVRLPLTMNNPGAESKLSAPLTSTPKTGNYRLIMKAYEIMTKDDVISVDEITSVEVEQ
jgi:hypothetical protein